MRRVKYLLMTAILLSSLTASAQLTTEAPVRRTTSHTLSVNGGLGCITSKLYTVDGEKSWLTGLDVSAEYTCVFSSGYGFGIVAERSSTDYGGDYLNQNYIGPEFVMASNMSRKWRGKVCLGGGLATCYDDYTEETDKGFGLRAGVGIDYKLTNWLGVGAELADYLIFFGGQDHFDWNKGNGIDGIQRFIFKRNSIFMMKRICVFFVFLFAALNMSAQGKFCKSYDDFVAGRWTEVADLKPIHHSASHKLWVGGNDYKFETGDKAMDKVMKKEAFVIEYQDTLYVNLRTLRYEKTRFGNGYAMGLPYDGTKIMFVTHRIGRDAANERFVSGFMFGAIGAAISGSSQLKDRVCYLVDNNGDGKKTDITLINDEFMENLLELDRPLLKTYRSEKKQKDRESAAHVLPILKEKGLVK